MKLLLAMIGVVLLAIGVATLFAPDLLAWTFGIPTDGPSSRVYVRATGIRDLAMGCWLLALLRFGTSQRILAASALSMALVAAANAANVFVSSGGRGSLALIGHGGGLIVLVALGLRLWRTREE